MNVQQPHLTRLPLVTLYLTERCNSRCITCDYWRHGRVDISVATIEDLLPSLELLGTKVLVLSGGEPLIHPQWSSIAELLTRRGIELWLLTSGLSLAKHAATVARHFENITVSLDGADAATYAAIRGVDAFERVCEGVRRVCALGKSVSIRVTLQRANFRQLPQFVSLARELKVRQVSFLAVDVANPHAFGRSEALANNLALGSQDLIVLEEILRRLEVNEAGAFAQNMIAESPAKLRRIHQYFAAIQGCAPFPTIRCNAPEFSAVIGTSGQVQPCFFIAAPTPRSPSRAYSPPDLRSQLNSEPMTSLRSSIRAGARLECKTCVCTLYRPEFASA